jgi:4-hydroxybenzoate polyprenyltransferase
MHGLVSILRLVRLPNVFTAIADIMMGYLFVHGNLHPVPVFGCLLIASASLYMAGMVWNDWFDLASDRQLRPERPIPSGQVSASFAVRLGAGLLVVGLLAAVAVAGQSAAVGWLRWRPPLVASLLALAIVIYDGALKSTPLAPVVMGTCRALNILLGMSVAAAAAAPTTGLLGFDASQWAVALGLGTFVAGITWFARDEAEAKRQSNLVGGMIVMAAGLTLLASFHRFGPFATGERQLTFRVDAVWPLAVALLGLSTLRRCWVATIRRSPAIIQTAVKQCILSLIFFDAAVTMAVCPGLVWPLAVLALIVPFLSCGLWIRST